MRLGVTWRRVAAAAACLAVTACATPERIAGNGSADEFSRVGRFALTATSDDGKQDAVQGGFAWLDDGRRYVLDLTNPLGATQARVEGRPGAASLTRSDGTQLRAGDPDELVEQALGSPIPVSGLRDWLRGRLPAQPPASDVQRDSEGRPTVFAQGGWRARLSRYDADGPQVLGLERQETGRRILLRLVVDPS